MTALTREDQVAESRFSRRNFTLCCDKVGVSSFVVNVIKRGNEADFHADKLATESPPLTKK